MKQLKRKSLLDNKDLHALAKDLPAGYAYYRKFGDNLISDIKETKRCYAKIKINDNDNDNDNDNNHKKIDNKTTTTTRTTTTMTTTTTTTTATAAAAKCENNLRPHIFVQKYETP